MDSNLTDNISTIVSSLWTYFYGTTAPSGMDDIAAADILGYGGGSIAFFLAVAGAYDAGSSVVEQVEISFFSFLEDFQTNDAYTNVMSDEAASAKFHKFLIYYASDLVVLTVGIFWHVGFLIGMGFLTAYLIFNKMKSSFVNDTTDIDIDLAWKLMFFGTLMGGTLYLAGTAISVKDDTIIKMVGFSPYASSSDDTTKTVSETDSVGTTTTITTVSKIYEVKKDLFGLQEMQENWGMLFLMQRTLQIALPYLYLGLLEGAVGLVFSLLYLYSGAMA